MRGFIIGSVALASLVMMPAASFAAETYTIDLGDLRHQARSVGHGARTL